MTRAKSNKRPAGTRSKKTETVGEQPEPKPEVKPALDVTPLVTDANELADSVIEDLVVGDRAIKDRAVKDRSIKDGAIKDRAIKDGGVSELIVVPVRNLILFPGVAMPLMIGRAGSIRAVQAAVEASKPVALLLQKEESIEEPGPDDLYEIGTIAEIPRYWTGDEGRHQAVCHGLARFRILEYTRTTPLLIARVEQIDLDETPDRKTEAHVFALRQSVEELLTLAPGAPPEGFVDEVKAMSASALVDTVACLMLDVPPNVKQEILATFELDRRLDKVQRHLADHIEVLRLSAKIRNDTRGSLDKAQREYYLREQLRAIQRELGDEQGGELAELRASVEALPLSEVNRRDVERSLTRLERMPEQSAEHPMLRTWVETVIELPWVKESQDQFDLERAGRILDEDHYGLDKVKKRILETLAVRKLRKEGGGTTLCFVGPPGVGKTSLGKSIARALGREFIRISLGGVHDEGEIRGHRRTYVGSMPGKILMGFRRAGTSNPVFMLDEMDKLGTGIHGDPSSALLEVLDPAQNHSFRDHYLDLDFDLSKAMFIATANVLDSVPRALRDRLEVIEISGYTEREKLEIAKRYLVARQQEMAGLRKKDCVINAAALREIIRHDTREAGVRELERRIGALCRHAATRIAGRKRRPKKGMSIDGAVAREILGARRYEADVALRTRVPGVSTGLAWTPVGGEVLFIEATRMPGTGQLLLTGQLGDVMKESARTALSLIQSNRELLGVPEMDFSKQDIHVHVPAGAVPKDGPSAGVAMVAALVSLFTNRCVRKEMAMTGEISLRGLVMPVGGIKEKVLGALAAGIKTVILPHANRKDIEEVPSEARKGLKFETVERVEDAIELCLQRAPIGKTRS
ncbi:MAG: ATP-dependent Lon protease [Planctomycetota bacterium]